MESKDTFLNLKNSPLTKLVLNQCNINRVYSGWFAYLPELKQISLSITTDIYALVWEMFTTGLDKTKLNTISLSLVSKNIYFQPEPLDIVRRFNETKLTTLELTDTKFYSVEDDVIAKLPKSLRKLNLTRNYIALFGVENLKSLENLETLHLSNQVDFTEYVSRKNIQGAFEYSHKTESRKQPFSSLLTSKINNICRVNELQE